MERRYQRSHGMVGRKIADEVILVPIRNNVGDLQCIYSLNEVGAFLWERIGEGQTGAELVKAVCGEFHAERAEVERDVAEFLAQMESVGAVAVS